MAALRAPPFELDAEPLVTGSIDISNDRLVQGFSWLVAAVQEQNRVLGALSTQIDSLKAAQSGAASELHQDGGRASMKEEMLLMQINAIKHEVGSLPRSSDLERQRERTMAEVQSISSSLSDRHRESAERLQKELADVTESLCNQLKRIGDDVFSRLETLEQRPQVQQQASSASQPLPPSQLQPPEALGGIPPPLPNPMSSSSIAAEATEDHTDGLVLSEGNAAVAGGRVAADLAVLDARLTGRLDAVERQLQDLRNQQEAVRQIASQAQVATMQPAQQHPEPVNPEASSPSDPQPVANTVAAAPAETPAAPEAPSQSSTGLQQDSTRQGDPIDMSAILSAAVAAASEAGTAAATQAVAEAMQKEHGLYSALQEEMLDVKSKVQLLNQSAPAEVQEAQEVPQEAQETPQQGRQTQADSMEPSTEATAPSQEDLVAMQERLSSVEAAVKQAAQQVEEHLPQMRAVPHLETSLLTIQQSLAQLQSLAQPSQPSQPSQPQPTPSDAKTVTRTEEKAQATFCSELPEPAPEDAGRNKDMMALSDEELERLMARLQDVEELQEKAERRIQLLESRSREARSRSGSISLDRKSPAIRSTASKTSEPPSGGSLGGSWKDVQAELERFRKLFEFIEGVLPQDAAEAMRFFNRRQAGKEELSEMISDVFGADVEFQNAKSQLESEFKMQTRELRREFDKLTLALKGLQRDVDTSGSKVVDLTRRTSQLETEVRTSPAVATSSMEDPHQEPSPRGPGGRRDSKDIRDKALQGLSQELQRAMQELRDEIRQWIELFKASVVQALQTKPDHEQVADFVKQILGASAGEQVALFAKRQLLGKCASCEAPIDVDMMRVKRPQPIGMQEHWPPGESIGAKVAIRPLNVGPLSPGGGSISRLPKINDLRNRENPKAKGMKSSASTPELRKEEPAADIA